LIGRIFKRASPARIGIPSSEEKRLHILEIARKYRCTEFVETGTFLGDSVEFLKPSFRRIVSIELAHDLAERAKRRFQSEKTITIIEGDSGELLAGVLETIDEPALFWLDGHYSHSCTVGGEVIYTALGSMVTPIIRELETVLGSEIPHVILIDDARLFTGHGGYPTLAEIENLVPRLSRKHTVSVELDVIAVLPPQRIA
jgi:hypothetical protein